MNTVKISVATAASIATAVAGSAAVKTVNDKFHAKRDAKIQHESEQHARLMNFVDWYVTTDGTELYFDDISTCAMRNTNELINFYDRYK